MDQASASYTPRTTVQKAASSNNKVVRKKPPKKSSKQHKFAAITRKPTLRKAIKTDLNRRSVVNIVETISAPDDLSAVNSLTIANIERRAVLRHQLADVQRQLAEMGEFYPAVVRHAGDLRSALGEQWQIDASRPTLQLPSGDLVIPIVGGGWQFRPA